MQGVFLLATATNTLTLNAGLVSALKSKIGLAALGPAGVNKQLNRHAQKMWL
jgi:hypothetical protein